MRKRFRNLKIRTLFIHILVTAAYPVAKAVTAEQHKLTVFCDVLTIVAGILLIAGVVYGLALHGDFDIAGYTFRRGFRSGQKQTYDAYRKNMQEKREDAFNYPLFLGILYLIVSAVIAWFFL